MTATSGLLLLLAVLVDCRVRLLIQGIADILHSASGNQPPTTTSNQVPTILSITNDKLPAFSNQLADEVLSAPSLVQSLPPKAVNHCTTTTSFLY